MDDQTLIETATNVLVNTYPRPDVIFNYGIGCLLYDNQGREYLDFASGIAVIALGHSDPEWIGAVQAAAAQLTHVSNLYHTAAHIELAAGLVEHSFADRVFFCNSGSEANEGALKFARKFARTHYGEGKTGIVAFTGGFHGRTMGALSATDRDKYRAPFAPLVPGVTFATFNDPAAAEAAINDETCAVIVEPLQGEGGVNPATAEFMQAVRAACDAHNALLICDEVQSGLGRTGKLWGHQHYDITPDIMTLAKPLANGLPIGAVLVTEAVGAVIKPGDHGSTFAGGPLVTAAANVVLKRITQPDFLAQVETNGNYLQHKLRHLESEAILDVRGQGLLVGIQMAEPVIPLVNAAREQGLLVIPAGEKVLRMAPPLIVSKAEIDQAVEKLERCL